MPNSSPQDLKVRHQPDESQYELREAGESRGVLRYHRRGQVVDAYSTQIRPDARGRGMGAVLVRAVLDDLRAAGSTVVPSCWYVSDFIDEHAEYQDLLASH